MNEKFELEPSNEPIREAINLVNQAEDFETLAELAFNNKLIGSKFNPLRYEHLKEVKGEVFTSEFPDYDRNDGYLIDSNNEKTDVHITQEYHEATDEAFFVKAKETIIEFLSMKDEDFEENIN